ncbi:MAG TPA: AAA family ATPase [Microvirga sp.]|nr:AAA family ATPase [Microvirga sp.]
MDAIANLNAPLAGPADSEGTLRVPQITVHGFCETPEVIAALQAIGADRRMSRANLAVHPAGIPVALELYGRAATPNLIILENRAQPSEFYAQLDALADVCSPGTKVIVIGYTNDISLYRELLARGVSEYMVAPVDPISIIAVIARLYAGAGATRLGRSFAFIGAKGGVGSSTVAHNVASAMATSYDSDVILADMDLSFGSAGLGFNLDQTQGIAQALQDPSRLDDVLLNRLVSKVGDHLGVLPAPASLLGLYGLEERAFEPVVELAQSTVPFVVLDIPHAWTAWVKNTLVSADEVVITAVPDLVSLRNARNLVDLLRQARPNDEPPKLVLNQVGVPKRAEIKPEKFAAALQLEPLAVIPFDPQRFSAAANKGQMLADVAANSTAAKAFAKVAQTISGRRRTTPRTNRFGLGRLLKR